ncbi:MAG: hypothetical protein ACK5TH_01475 [Prosthecobacter sp.]
MESTDSETIATKQATLNQQELTMTNQAKEVLRPRNLYLRIPPQMKETLKELAVGSGMSLDEYVTSVVEDAIEHGYRFQIVKKKISKRESELVMS